MRAIGLFMVFFCTAIAGYGQIDTSRIEVKPHQVDEVTNQDNLYSKELPKDLGAVKDSVAVDIASVPGRIKRRLNQEPQYKDWESGQMYLSRNTGLYMLYLYDSAQVRVYTFDKRGKPVTVDTFDRKKDE